MWGKIAIGTRFYADPRAEFVASLLRLAGSGLCPGDMILEPVIRWNVVTALTKVCQRFLASPCDSMLILEDDVVFNPEDLKALRNSGQEYGILSALFPARRYPFNPQVFRSMRRSKNNIENLRGIIDVEAVPFGFCLIRREVIQKITEVNGERIARWGVCDECISFCEQVRGFGFKVGMNTDVSVGHILPAIPVYWDRDDSKPRFDYDNLNK
ncbi:MAG: hypothetical protein L6455_14595 [Kiritimatiellae bacterium]|nr:hypothetical protein [Kiritimatiellia bacterium]